MGKLWSQDVNKKAVRRVSRAERNAARVQQRTMSDGTKRKAAWGPQAAQSMRINLKGDARSPAQKIGGRLRKGRRR